MNENNESTENSEGEAESAADVAVPEQIPAVEETELSPKAKDRQSRASVRQELREQRQTLRELRQRLKNGENLTDDIEACNGQIELLYKELQAIEEGGHTTFLEAKDVIAPKMNYSEKKENLKDQIKDIKKEISALEESLYQPNLTDHERDGIISQTSKLKKEQDDLSEEMNALLQFNHTRFVEAREENKENILKAQEEQELEAKKEVLKQELADANSESDLAKANDVVAKIAEIEEAIKNFSRPQEDIFLEKFDEGENDPFLEK